MSGPEDNALVDRFLRRVREKTQWHENWQVLAPGDFTPYLQVVVTAALGTLAQKLPDGSLEIHRATQTDNQQPLPAKWWTFRHAGVLFDIEGLVPEGKIQRRIAEQMQQSGVPKGTPYSIQRGRTPDIVRVFQDAQGPGLKVLGIVQEAWATEFEAPRLRANTQVLETKSRPKGRL